MSKFPSYKATLDEMFALQRFGIKLGLGTIRNILKGLGNPQNSFACIHIAGTNGKGSIASGLAAILQATGFRTGLYTSPHLIDFNERITVDNQPISDKRVVEAYQKVKNLHHGSREPTFFEFTTAMALYEFAARGVEWAIIETGMGGRLDATNMVKPAVSIISNISLEHRMYLGNTIAQIAGEKGGIIKNRIPVVTGARQPDALAVIGSIARRKSAPFYRFGKDFRVRRNKGGTFNYYGMDHTWRQLKLSLIGPHQVDNAALVLAACETLIRSKKTGISETHVREGLKNIRWPGRLEFVGQSPRILLDGAHNLAAARNLARFLRDSLHNRDITLVAGILDDKPYKAMLQPLMKLCKRVIVTRPVIDRALDPEVLYAAAKQVVRDVSLFPSVDKAVSHAVATAAPDEIICIAGSLYVVGEAKQTLSQLL
ncbi:MAG: bifunctional folylpolyglutamate synthase/dihydrofolate synthase [Deltaproteobacteria bacterium]|nr:bifunctional folylpolyglutamate synthase/dihydrofolate synthase [Deltaproteobacteria bacterium]MBW2633112.1 bifunctional folylpolyglutamate synthase/dihydrofolate synthase [Deltaproteobacteria bacterium]MBW2678541.1 bifunctional folylpolyglutamate synthase/dihydrofolate synthase [Deltaproteobacteria bacterium]